MFKKSNLVFKNMFLNSQKRYFSKVFNITAEKHLDNLKNDKKAVLDCFAEWCGPCHMIAPTYSKLSEKYSGIFSTQIDVNFYKIDVDTEEDELQEFLAEIEIEAMPSFFTFKNGEVDEKLVGANEQKLEEIIKTLNEK